MWRHRCLGVTGVSAVFLETCPENGYNIVNSLADISHSAVMSGISLAGNNVNVVKLRLLTVSFIPANASEFRYMFQAQQLFSLSLACPSEKTFILMYLFIKTGKRSMNVTIVPDADLIFHNQAI